MLWSVPPYHFSVCWYSQPKMKRGLSGRIHCIYHQLHQSVCKLWKCRFFAGMYGLSIAGFKYQLLDKVYQVIALVLDYCDVWSGNSSRFSIHDQDAWTAATSDISCTYGFCIIWYDHHMFHILASVNNVIGIHCAPMEVDDQFYFCPWWLYETYSSKYTPTKMMTLCLNCAFCSFQYSYSRHSKKLRECLMWQG